MKVRSGFTLIELLVVISVMGLLASIAIVRIDVTRKKARDAARIASMRQFQKALDIYFQEYGYYPSCVHGHSSFGFSYRSDFCSSGSPITGLSYDNSSSSGFIDTLAEVGIMDDARDWLPPLGELGDFSSKYNCRYVIMRDDEDSDCRWEDSDGDGLPDGDSNGDGNADDGTASAYLLHCYLENSPEVSANDGGCNDDYYEIAVPEGWLGLKTGP